MKRRTPSLTALSGLALATALLAAGTPRAESPNARLATELVRLRAEVESLSEDLELKRTELREETAALAQRKAEVEAEVQRERLRLNRLEASLDEQRTALVAATAGAAELEPVVLEATSALRGAIQRGLPFRMQERLAAVDEIEQAVRAHELATDKAALRLWSLYQDESRLTKESGLYRQPIVVGDQEELAEVVRVGMVMLYFKTASGLVGHSVESADGWAYRVATDEADQRRIEALFDAFKKQIRVGYFELPNALPEVTK